MNSYILAIESSCDETAVAIINNHRKILGHALKSQIKLHQPFGGVVPEIAARAHLDVLPSLIRDTLSQAQLSLKQISAFAATAGPGLAGGLLVGTTAAKTLSILHNKPFIPVNHLEAHTLTPSLLHPNLESFIILLLSGGHSLLALVKKPSDYSILGQTLDDAAGEAFDKTARLLNLPPPGGPALEELAKNGNPLSFAFTPPMQRQHPHNCNFSFSGLKSSVARTVQKLPKPIDNNTKSHIAAAFQHTVIQHLISRTSVAFQSVPHLPLALSGGVASNLAIRLAFEKLCLQHNRQLFIPPPSLCTDNAVMIAFTALLRFLDRESFPISFPINPRWKLSCPSETPEIQPPKKNQKKIKKYVDQKAH
jgi:N6-L-threonylcarbamoyladenine synthase